MLLNLSNKGWVALGGCNCGSVFPSPCWCPVSQPNWTKGKPWDCPCRSSPQRLTWRHQDSPPPSAHQDMGSLPTQASCRTSVLGIMCCSCPGISKELGEENKVMGGTEQLLPKEFQGKPGQFSPGQRGECGDTWMNMVLPLTAEE